MGIQDTVNYVLFTNPIASGTAYYLQSTASSAYNYIKPQSRGEVKMVPPEPLWKLAATAGPYVRLAALSGAAAVILGAYGSHREYPETADKQPNQKQVFQTASHYHFIHSLALLGLPFCRARFLAATFLCSGILLFSGTCYYYAFTGDLRYRKATPIGGVCFILGWLSMLI